MTTDPPLAKYMIVPAGAANQQALLSTDTYAPTADPIVQGIGLAQHYSWGFFYDQGPQQLLLCSKCHLLAWFPYHTSVDNGKGS